MNWNNNVYKYLRLYKQGHILVLINRQGEAMQVDFSKLKPILGSAVQLQDLMNDQSLELDLDVGLDMKKDGVRIFLIKAPN